LHSVYVSFLAFLIVFAGAVVGIYLRRVLPDDHFSPDAKVVIRLSTGFVVTMTGLVLGMLVSSAKSSYDAEKLMVAHVSTDLVLLDRSLVEYGPETASSRTELREFVEASVHRIWPLETFSPVHLQPTESVDKLEAQLKALTPRNDSQLSAKTNAIAILADLRQASWLTFVQSDGNSLPMPLLVVLVAWLVVIFMSFGLFAPPNPTVIATLLLAALAVSGAILIIMDMYSPFIGILRISSAPIRDALSQFQH
jgi:hypothetical protein